MIETKKDEGIFLLEEGGKSCLVLDGEYRSNNVASIVTDSKASSLAIHNLPIDGDSLSFLSGCPNIKEVEINGLTSSKMVDFSLLNALRSIKKLSVDNSNFTSLSGITAFENLEYLELGHLSHLKDMQALQEMTKLKQLTIHTCKKAERLEKVLGRLENIECLVLAYQQAITDLKFLKNLTKLKEFRLISTRVLSGDLSPLLENSLCLELVEFSDRKNYSHNLLEIHDILSDRKQRRT